MDIDTSITELEHFLGFQLYRQEITLESGHPYEETLSYGACHRFFNQPHDLDHTLQCMTVILSELQKDPNSKTRAVFFSFLGDLYYIKGDFQKSLGCYMKALSNNKEDTTLWAGFMFSLRSLGLFDFFEDIMFHFNDFYLAWKNDPHKEFTKQKADTIRRDILAKYLPSNYNTDSP